MIKYLIVAALFLSSESGWAQQNTNQASHPDATTDVKANGKNKKERPLKSTKHKKNKHQLKVLKDGKIETSTFAFLGENKHGKRKVKTKSMLNADLTEIVAMNNQKIEDAKQKIKQRIDEACKAIEDKNNADNDIYRILWGSPYFSDVCTDLLAIRAKLERGSYKQDIAPNRPYYDLDVLISALYQKKDYYTPLTLSDKTQCTFTLKRTDPLGDLLVTYYNQKMKNLKNQLIVSNNKLGDMEKMADESRLIMDKCNQYLSTSYLNGTTWSDLNELYNFAVAKDTRLQEYFRCPWFGQWIWYTAGKLTTTPLGFTGDDQIRISMQDLDKEKMLMFEKYVSHENELFNNADSIIDVTVYKKAVLDNWGKGKALFLDSVTYKEHLADNKKKREDFLGYKEYVCNITVPYKEKKPLSHYLVYSSDDVASAGKVKKLNPVTNNDDVVVTVCNIPNGNSAAMVKKAADDIDDTPPVAVEFADATKTLSSALNSLTGIQGAIIAFLDNQNRQRDQQVVQLQKASVIPPPVPLPPPPPPPAMQEEKHIALFKDTDNDGIPDIHENMKSHHQLTEVQINDIIGQVNNYHLALLREFESDFPGVKAEIEKIKFENSRIKALIIAHRGLPYEILLEDVQSAYRKSIIQGELAQIISPFAKEKIRSKRENIAEALTIIREQQPPIEKLEAKEKKEPAFHNEIMIAENMEKAKEMKYDIVTLSSTKKDTVKLKTITFKTAKRHFIQASVGITYSFSSARVNKVTTDKGNVTITTKEEQYGVAAMLHIYPLSGGVFLQDKSFCGHNWTNIKGRMNITAGIDFRKVPDNVYLGVGYDFGPGIRVSTGAHFYKYTKYELINNQIADQGDIYKVAFPYIYLGIDPIVLVNTLNIFKK